MNDDLKEAVAITALNDMMEKGRFDVCCVRDVSKMLGVNPEMHPSFKLLPPLHMISFAKMPDALREAVPRVVQECLGVAPTFQFTSAKPQVIEVQDAAPARSGFLRLLGGK